MLSKKPWQIRVNSNQLEAISVFLLKLTFVLMFFLVLNELNRTLTVQNVIIEGSEDLSSKIDLFRGRSMLLIDENEFARQIKAHDISLEEVSVEKVLPNTVKIKAKNKKPVAQVLWQGINYLVDNTGFVFSAKYKQQILPVVSGQFTLLSVGYQFERPLAMTLFPLLESLAQQGMTISKVEVFNRDFIIFDEASGVVIRYSTFVDPLMAASSLQMMWRSFKIEDKFPKRIDLLYDKPVISF